MVLTTSQRPLTLCHTGPHVGTRERRRSGLCRRLPILYSAFRPVHRGSVTASEGVKPLAMARSLWQTTPGIIDALIAWTGREYSRAAFFVPGNFKVAS